MFDEKTDRPIGIAGKHRVEQLTMLGIDVPPVRIGFVDRELPVSIGLVREIVGVAD